MKHAMKQHAKQGAKRLCALLVSASLCLTGIPAIAVATDADASEVESNLLYMVDEAWGFYYTTYSDGTAEITGSNDAAGETSITFPDTIVPSSQTTSGSTDSTTYTITDIAASASQDECLFGDSKTTLQTIKLPAKLETVGAFTFAQCSALTYVTFGECMKTFQGNGIFRNCTALKTFTLKSSNEVTIDGNYFFYYDTALESITFDCDLVLTSNATTFLPGLSTGDSIETFTVTGDTTLGASIGGTNGMCAKTAFDFQGDFTATAANTMRYIGQSIHIGGDVYTSVTNTFAVNSNSATTFSLESFVCDGDYTSTQTTGNDFYGAKALETVEIKGAMEQITGSMFYNCTALTSVELSGDSIGYVGASAFYGCSALEYLELPPIVSDSSGSKILANAFNGCSSLKTLAFRGDVSAYDSQSNPTYLFANTNALTSCSKLSSVLFYGYGFTTDDMNTSGALFSSGTSTILAAADLYYSIDFFEDEAAAAAAERNQSTLTDASGNPYTYYSDKTALCRLHYKEGTSTGTIMQGSPEGAYDQDNIESIPALTDGKIWGLDMEKNPFLECSLRVVPAEMTGLNYAYIDVASELYVENGPFVASDFPVIDLGGSPVDASLYTLHMYQVTTGDQRNEVDVVSETGSYIVNATGNDTYTGTQTADFSFEVTEVAASFDEYSGSSSTQTATAGSDLAAERGTTVPYSVVASADDPVGALVGASLSGISGSTLILAGSTATTTTAFVDALADEGASDAVIVEADENAVSTSIEYVMSTSGLYSKGSLSRMSGGPTPTYGTSTNGEDLSVAAYDYVNALAHEEDSDIDGWGTTAIVASGVRSYGTNVIAQYAYQAQAPVFLTDSEGNLSDATLSLIKSGDFEQIIIAGDTVAVTDGCEASLTSQSGAQVSRMLSGDVSAYEKSVEAADCVCETFGNSSNNILVTDATDSALVAASATVAAQTDAVLLTIASTADEKSVIAIINEVGSRSLKGLVLMGELSAMSERITAYYAGVTSTALAAGDTLETQGLLFTMQEDGTLAFVEAVNPTLSGTITIDSVTYDGNTYSLSEPLTYEGTYDPSPEAPEDENPPEPEPGTGNPDGNNNPGTTDNPGGKVLKSQTIKVKPAKKALKASKIAKKTQKLTFKVSGASTKLVAKASGKKAKKALKIKVKGKKLKVQVKKKTKKGTYKIKVYAAKSASYAQSATKTITIKVK